jgi:ABC-type lipoprotein release transport system permease subunit
VYNDQGYYSKIIAPVFSNGAGCATSSGAKFIAEYMTKEQGFRVQWYGNEILKSIDQNGKLITDFTGLVLIIAIVLAVFSVFMLFNYISTSIVSKRRSIGVLRALGSSGKDVFSMFITESLVISIINGIFACIVAFVGCIFVNYYIKNIMEMTVDFAIYGVRQVIIIMLASVITGVISSLLPIIRICKEKPVDLIRKP